MTASRFSGGLFLEIHPPRVFCQVDYGIKILSSVFFEKLQFSDFFLLTFFAFDDIVSQQPNMGEFPSGQRGQTVNLLAVLSVVQIHLPPPKTRMRKAFGFLLFTAYFFTITLSV